MKHCVTTHKRQKLRGAREVKLGSGVKKMVALLREGDEVDSMMRVIVLSASRA